MWGDVAGVEGGEGLRDEVGVEGGGVWGEGGLSAQLLVAVGGAGRGGGHDCFEVVSFEVLCVVLHCFHKCVYFL